MRNAWIIFEKQLKDTLKNKTVLIQFVMFPVLTVIMSNTIHIEGMPANYFVNLFATMFIGMAPLTGMAAIISEEKEKNTLRVLLMSNVKPGEYILGISAYIFLICMAGAVVMGLAGDYEGKRLTAFLGIVAVGIMTSLLMGAAIGAFCENQMRATSLTVPVMMVFSFLPMLAMFNETIAKVARFTYSDQVSLFLSEAIPTLKGETVLVIGANMLVALVCFLYAYKRKVLS